MQSELCSFWDGTGTVKKLIPEKCLGTGTGKHWLRKKVQVPEKFGPGKKYWYRYQKILVSVLENSREFGTGTREFPEIFHFWGGTKKSSGTGTVIFGPGKSTSTGNGKNWSRKKYRYRYRKSLVLERIGPGKKYRYGYGYGYPHTLLIPKKPTPTSPPCRTAAKIPSRVSHTHPL